MPPESTPIRILVIDDDEMSRELLTVLLEAEGYTVASADSGESALALLRQKPAPPDLILADLQMPGTTGPRLARELRRVCGPSTLLLAMSGSRPSAKSIALYDAFLLKPFKMEEIATALSARTPQPTSQDAPATHEKWTVISGPARTASPQTKLLSIAAFPAKPASKNSMGTQSQTVQSTSSPPGDNPSDLPVLNETIYKQLAVSMPPKQLIEMYTMCLNDARSRIASMRILADEHDAAKFVREAHAIKGGCGMLGATELHRMAAELEKNGPDTASTSSTEVNSLDELSAACDRLERMLGSRA
jgi:CheY-like chemotaxis protein